MGKGLRDLERPHVDPWARRSVSFDRHWGKPRTDALGHANGIHTHSGLQARQKASASGDLSPVAEALDVTIAWLVRDEQNETGEAECEGLTEELLGLVRDLRPEELRHVLELVRAVALPPKASPGSGLVSGCTWAN